MQNILLNNFLAGELEIQLTSSMEMGPQQKYILMSKLRLQFQNVVLRTSDLVIKIVLLKA